MNRCDSQNHDIIPITFKEWLSRYNINDLEENEYNMLKSAYITGFKTGQLTKE